MPIQVSNQPDAFRDFERSGWNAVSEGYEAVFGPLTAQSVDVTLDAAGVIGGCDVLDVCTGHGVLALAATERGAKVCTVDFSEHMVAAARRNAPSVDCRQGDAQDLPYPDNGFDAVVCGYGILHVPVAWRCNMSRGAISGQLLRRARHCRRALPILGG